MSSVSSFAIDWLNEHCQTTPAIALQRIQRERESQERAPSHNVIGRGYLCRCDARIEGARTWRQLCLSSFLFLLSLLSHTHKWVSEWVGVLYPLVHSLTLTYMSTLRCTYIGTHMRTYNAPVSGKKTSQSGAIWRLFKHLSKEIANLKWI